MPNPDKPEYSVGYKKPPHCGRFKKGQSGNISGRPRKARSSTEVLEKELLTAVTMVDENGKRQKISKLEAMIKQLINRAAKGDHKATALILDQTRAQKQTEGDGLAELLQQLRARHAHLAVEESPEPQIRQTDGRDDEDGTAGPSPE